MDLATDDGTGQWDAAVPAHPRPPARVAGPHNGHLTFRRLLGSLAGSLYTAGLFACTMLPLPDPAELDCSGGPVIQLRPLQFLADIRNETAGLSTAGMLTPRVTLPRPVTVWQRWFAMLLDWLGIGVLSTAFAVVLGTVLQVAGWVRPAHGMEVLLNVMPSYT